MKFQKEAELYLPGLTAREGIMINMDDMSTLQEWTFKYRFDRFSIFFNVNSIIDRF